MKRAIVSVITAVFYLAASVPHTSALAEPKRDIWAQLNSIPPGTVVEVQFKSETKVIGRIRSFTDQRLVIDQGTKTTEYFVSDVVSVQRRLLGDSDLQLSPALLGSVVLDHDIKAMTRDGVYIQGKVLQATEEALIIDISKSEPKGRFRGISKVSTADLGVVYMRKKGGVAAPVALGVAAGFLSLVGTTYLAMRTNANAAGAFLVIGGTAAGAAAGAYAGREISRKTVTISVTQ